MSEEQNTSKSIFKKIPRPTFDQYSYAKLGLVSACLLTLGYFVYSGFSESSDDTVASSAAKAGRQSNASGGVIEKNNPNMQKLMKEEEAEKAGSAKQSGDTHVARLVQTTKQRNFNNDTIEQSSNDYENSYIGIDDLVKDATVSYGGVVVEKKNQSKTEAAFDGANMKKKSTSGAVELTGKDAERYKILANYITNITGRDSKLSRISIIKVPQNTQRGNNVDQGASEQYFTDQQIAGSGYNPVGGSYSPNSVKKGSNIVPDTSKLGGAPVASSSKKSENTVVIEHAPNLEGADYEAKSVYRPGDMVYARLINTASTDAPTKILASIEEGPLKGARLLGEFQPSRKGLVLNFNSMQFKGRTYPFSALAMDPYSYSTSMATKYNSRWLQRYGLMLASSFIQGFAQAKAQAQQSIINSVSGQTVVNDEPSSEDALWQGASNVSGSVAGDMMQSAAQIKPLIEVKRDTPLALMFLNSVYK